MEREARRKLKLARSSSPREVHEAGQAGQAGRRAGVQACRLAGRVQSHPPGFSLFSPSHPDPPKPDANPVSPCTHHDLDDIHLVLTIRRRHRHQTMPSALSQMLLKITGGVCWGMPPACRKCGDWPAEPPSAGVFALRRSQRPPLRHLDRSDARMQD